jgi:hypothetical protein
MGLTNLELPLYTVLVPLSILLLDMLISLQYLDKLPMYQCDLNAKKVRMVIRFTGLFHGANLRLCSLCSS